MKNLIPQSKYLTFLAVIEGQRRGKTIQGKHYFDKKNEAETYFKDYSWQYSNVVYVNIKELQDFNENKGSYRVMGTSPCVASLEPIERKKKMFHSMGKCQFNYGQYYDLRYLWFMDDIIAWSGHHLDFDKIRRGYDFISKGNKHKFGD